MTHSINSSNRFDFRFSSLLIAILAAAFFGLGLALGKYPNLSLSTSSENSLPNAKSQANSTLSPSIPIDFMVKFFFSPALLIASLTVVNRRVNQEIEQEVKAKTDDLASELELEITERIEHKYSEPIKKLRDEIRPYLLSGGIAKEDQDEIDQCFTYLENIRKEHFKEVRLCDSIGRLLGDTKNLKRLLNYLCAGETSLTIPKDSLKEFQSNIEQCLLWLHYSLKDHCPYELEINRCGSAFKKGDVSIKTYQETLNKITKFPDIKLKLRDQKDFTYLGRWISDLISKLEEEM